MFYMAGLRQRGEISNGQLALIFGVAVVALLLMVAIAASMTPTVHTGSPLVTTEAATI